MSHLMDVETDVTANISPIVGIFDPKYTDRSLPQATEHSKDIISYGPSLTNAALFFVSNLDQLNGLSKDEAAAINLYTIESDYYKELNQRLRNRNRQSIIPFFPYLRLLLTGLNKLLPFQGTVWRGVKGIDLSSKFPKAKKFFWWSFSSCTADLSVLEMENFCGKTGVRTLFNIFVKQGRQISYFSAHMGESEILLLPATYLEVKGVMDAGNGLKIIQLEELLPPFETIIGMPTSAEPVVPPKAQQKLNGRWKIYNNYDKESSELNFAYYLTLKAENGILSGEDVPKLGPDHWSFKITGKIDGESLFFVQSQNNTVICECTAMIKGDTMTGIWKWPNGKGSGRFKGVLNE